MKEAGKAEADNAWSLQELGARSRDRQAGSFGGRPAKFNSQLNPASFQVYVYQKWRKKMNGDSFSDSEPLCPGNFVILYLFLIAQFKKKKKRVNYFIMNVKVLRERSCFQN